MALLKVELFSTSFITFFFGNFTCVKECSKEDHLCLELGTGFESPIHDSQHSSIHLYPFGLRKSLESLLGLQPSIELFCHCHQNWS